MAKGKYGHDETTVTITVPAKYKNIAERVRRNIQLLVQKNEAYGDSWKKRGGRGAWFTIVRPWDRLEQMVIRNEDDIFLAGLDLPETWGTESDILDSLRDIRNYFFLVEDEILKQREQYENAMIEQQMNQDLGPMPEMHSPAEKNPFGFDGEEE